MSGRHIRSPKFHFPAYLLLLSLYSPASRLFLLPAFRARLESGAAEDRSAALRPSSARVTRRGRLHTPPPFKIARKYFDLSLFTVRVSSQQVYARRRESCVEKHRLYCARAHFRWSHGAEGSPRTVYAFGSAACNDRRAMWLIRK